MPEEPKKAAAVSSSGSGQTGLFGGGEQVDAHSVKVSRALDYRYRLVFLYRLCVWLD